ncbi:hypothetical protein D3C71_1537780 [compost metagenome]
MDRQPVEQFRKFAEHAGYVAELLRDDSVLPLGLIHLAGRGIETIKRPVDPFGRLLAAPGQALQMPPYLPDLSSGVARTLQQLAEASRHDAFLIQKAVGLLLQLPCQHVDELHGVRLLFGRSNAHLLVLTGAAYLRRRWNGCLFPPIEGFGS